MIAHNPLVSLQQLLVGSKADRKSACYNIGTALSIHERPQSRQSCAHQSVFWFGANNVHNSKELIQKVAVHCTSPYSDIFSILIL